MVETIALMAFMCGNAYTEEAGGFSIKVPEFAYAQVIPKIYTCHGGNKTPPILWKKEPPGTESFALTMEDPDAAKGTWYHWIVYDIPPRFFGANNTFDALLKEGVAGKNSWGENRYDGPCPPSGKSHRYIFTLYALDTRTYLPPGASVNDLMQQMKDHVLKKSQWMGHYP
jgi:Raf kinase inhibitor-like YbhB/YbcL family protein